MNKAEEIKQILLKIQQMSDPGSAENAVIDMKILAGNGLKIMEQYAYAPTADGMEGGWISVEDRLPEGIYVPCLVCNMDAPEYNKHVFVASFFGQTKSFSTDNKFIGTITHWRPLPAPPTTP